MCCYKMPSMETFLLTCTSRRFWQVDVPPFCNELFSRNSILSYNVGAPLLYTYKTACATPPWTSEGARKNAVRETTAKDSTNHLKELVHAHRGIVDMSLGIYLKPFVGDGMEMAAS